MEIIVRLCLRSCFREWVYINACATGERSASIKFRMAFKYSFIFVAIACLAGSLHAVPVEEEEFVEGRVGPEDPQAFDEEEKGIYSNKLKNRNICLIIVNYLR